MFKILGWVAAGIIVFAIVDVMITNVITGTDTGSVLLQTLVRIVLAGLILFGMMKGLAGGGMKD